MESGSSRKSADFRWTGSFPSAGGAGVSTRTLGKPPSAASPRRHGMSPPQARGVGVTSTILRPSEKPCNWGEPPAVATPRTCVLLGPAGASANKKRKLVSRPASAALSAFAHDLLVRVGLAMPASHHGGQRVACARLDRSDQIEVRRALSCWHSFFLRLCGQGVATPELNLTVTLLRPRRAGVNGTKTLLWHETQHRGFGRDRHRVDAVT